MVGDYKIKAGTTLFAAPPDDKYIDEAKKYIKENNLNAENVKITRSKSGINVITKKEIVLGKGNGHG